MNTQKRFLLISVPAGDTARIPSDFAYDAPSAHQAMVTVNSGSGYFREDAASLASAANGHLAGAGSIITLHGDDLKFFSFYATITTVLAVTAEAYI